MQAMCGVINSTGFPDQPPVKSGAAICDFMAGIHLYAAIMTALYERERTGQGRVVEVSMQDATYCSLASNLGMLHARGADAPARTGNRHGGLGISPYNVYPTKDGYVVLNAPGDHHFRSILDVMGRPDLKEDPRFVTRSTRVANFAAVDELIESWTKTLAQGRGGATHARGEGALRAGARSRRRSCTTRTCTRAAACSGWAWASNCACYDFSRNSISLEEHPWSNWNFTIRPARSK